MICIACYTLFCLNYNCNTRYLAAKTHYFGVGGGTRSFEDMVKQRGEFNIEVCKTYTRGKVHFQRSLCVE